MLLLQGTTLLLSHFSQTQAWHDDGCREIPRRFGIGCRTGARTDYHQFQNITGPNPCICEANWLEAIICSFQNRCDSNHVRALCHIIFCTKARPRFRDQTLFAKGRIRASRTHRRCASSAALEVPNLAYTIVSELLQLKCRLASL